MSVGAAAGSGASDAIECEGAPRDLGLDQGLACGQGLRELFAGCPWWERAALHLGRRSDREQLLDRGLLRHSPHQAEVLAGLAVGARVPRAWLLRRLAAELAAPAEPVVVGAAAPGGPRIALRLAGPTVVRRKRPEGRFRSSELARPWLAGALLGVNEEGLAAALGPSCWDGSGAPASCLVQDCLERFASVDAALDWCLGRPAAPEAVLVFADARGELAGVEVAAGGRRVLRPADGLLVAGLASPRADELAKRLRDAMAAEAPDPLLEQAAQVRASERSLVASGRRYDA